jgi:hypothetical protein
MNFIDQSTQHAFELQQAKGLKDGEKALIYVGDEPILKDETICLYSNDITVLKRNGETDNKKQEIYNKFSAYAITINKIKIAVPNDITPNENNLGLFCNGVLKSDLLRQKPNAYICVEKIKSNCYRVTIESKKKINKGDEILICYGTGYIAEMKKHF